MKTRYKILLACILVIVVGIYYYVTIPAINIHAGGFWQFLIVVFVLLFLYSLGRGMHFSTADDFRNLGNIFRERTLPKVILVVIGLVILIYLVGAILSSPIVNADKYQKLLEPEDGDFANDVDEVDFTQIPILDKDSAELLGNRKMGSMVDMVSQFEVSPLYSQINYQGRPYRVTPLVYAGPIKWLTNQREGIPAYITIDMATQETSLVKLSEGIKYSESEYFNRNIYRHLRFHYPTYMFDQLSFEIDDDGVPYWICPVKKFKIGLFGGQTIGKVVLCNAITGECQSMRVEDCPQWVDRVYPAELLVELYNYHGTLIHGFINSIFGQKGCLQTTNGYNYIAQDDDVWVYTGVTSVSGDQSNVGFVLMNQRTKQTKYYEVAGAEEYSAMDSAEGQVQNLRYTAAFPLLINIAGEPTYIIALKDDAGLGKKYAMVNIREYQNVAIGDSVEECELTYREMLLSNGVTEEETVVEEPENESVDGTIERITQGVIDGSTHFYVMLENDDKIYDVPLEDHVDIIRYDVGDKITLTYVEGSPTCSVAEIE